MKLSINALHNFATESGFQKDTVEKVVRLGEVLEDIGKHPYLKHRLALKGGTALNMFFGQPRRMSVDLDFNYVGSPSREVMVQEKPEIENSVRRIASGQRYAVQDGGSAHAGRKLYLNYRNANNRSDRIEIDLNFLNRVPINGLIRKTMWQPGGTTGPETLLVSLEELVAGKLRALLDRNAPRDYYDAELLPQLLGENFSGVRFRRMFVLHTGTLSKPLYSYEIKEGCLDELSVQRSLIPMLTIGQKPTARALEDYARQVVHPLLQLDATERDFIDRLQAGEYNPNLLFPDEPELIKVLEEHPALRWKADNASKHKSKPKS